MVEARSVNVKTATAAASTFSVLVANPKKTTLQPVAPVAQIYVVANPVRGLLDRKRSEEYLPSSNESKIIWLLLFVVVSHIQGIGCQPEKNYFTTGRPGSSEVPRNPLTLCYLLKNSGY